MTKIADYDEFDYDYEKYWGDRDYENRAERIVLERYLKGFKGKFFLDIGGSFGRNLPAYCFINETPIILDYSLKTLKRNQKNILSQCSKTRLVAANAYHMPFKKEVIDGSIMVRVLHHIEKQKALFNEIERVTKGGGIFILEYANKMHLKARIKWLAKLEFRNFSTLPYQQPTQGNFEGVKDGKEAIFLNYHPRNITKLLHNSGFKILKKTNCSFLRINFLKKALPFPVLIALEKFCQKFLSWTNISPSIVLKNRKIKKSCGETFETFEDILCCPKCKKDLVFSGQKAICKPCEKTFKQEDGIWDFRI
jgi:ubiquinone/menaquinone biosynthesis C-methylase UbiE